ncbi:hypothetical protein ANTQUA_LOCUS3915 [Anthophora quadrimaculata]
MKVEGRKQIGSLYIREDNARDIDKKETVAERHQTRPSCFAGARGKKEPIWREDRAEREVIYGMLRCIMGQPWDDDDSRSGGWQANKSWPIVWEPLLICSSLRVWGMPSVKPLLL